MSYATIVLLFALLSNAFIYATGNQMPKIRKSVLAEQLNSSSKEPTRSASESTRLMNAEARSTRSVVLIDEDLDIPAQSGIKHDFDSGSTKNYFETIVDDLRYLEGSGDSTKSEFLSTVPHLNTVENLRKTTIKMAEEPQKEGSGDLIFSVPYSPSLATEIASNKDILLPTVASCFNKTCSDGHMININRVPEHTNITLTCEGNSNRTNRDSILWYIINGTEHFLLQISKKSHLEILQAKIDNTGTYVCIRQVEESCCYNFVRIKVYQVPDYSFHLLIIVVIAASAFLVCFLLLVSQKIRFKKQKKQLKNYMDNTEASFNLKVF